MRTKPPSWTIEHDSGADPWSLDLAERHALALTCARLQAAWLTRLCRLVEPPAPGPDFPAFLLALPCFARLARAIGTSEHRSALDTATADELQHFVDRYRGYLHDLTMADAEPADVMAW